MLECGINGKMNELQAALGLCVLDLIENERAARRELAAIYRDRLGDLAGRHRNANASKCGSKRSVFRDQDRGESGRCVPGRPVGGAENASKCLRDVTLFRSAASTHTTGHWRVPIRRAFPWPTPLCRRCSACRFTAPSESMVRTVYAT